MSDNAIIILAAGNASRMGAAKQLLSFNNTTFIQHIIEEATKTTGEKVILVLGAYVDEIKTSAKKKIAHIVINPNWQTGMASSIQTGVNAVLRLFPETENMLITVADQPFVSAELFKEIFAAKNNSDKNMVACSYADAIGTPVLFNKKYFSELLQLRGQEGAKKMVMKHKDDAAIIAFDKGAIDIDTEEDYEQLQKMLNAVKK